LARPLHGAPGRSAGGGLTIAIPARRLNNPPAAIAAEGRTPPAPKLTYAYSPRLDPALRFDPSGGADALPSRLEQATREPLTAEEAALLGAALRRHDPWLEWPGKAVAQTEAARRPWPRRGAP